MKKLLGIFLCLFSAPTWAAPEPSAPDGQATVIVVVGAAGEDEFGQEFAASAKLWQSACEKGGAKLVMIGLGPTNGPSDFDQLKKALADEPKTSANELWLVLLGHGTFDGKEGKFNLRGPDFSTTDLAAWLQPFKRRLALIDCSSSSAPFMSKLTGPDRVIITATRSGYEQNYARFGKYISQAITDPQADLDKDGQVSLLEAFLMGSRRLLEFYNAEGRLATEHPLLDDNGDGLGTPADWFRGIHAVKQAKAGAQRDGLHANQFQLVRSAGEQQLPAAVRARRDELELAINRLRETKSKFKEDEYYEKLEPLVLEMSRLSEQTAPATNATP